jgi:diacylglycerol kinase (ATP)
MHIPEKNIALLCNPTRQKALRVGDDIAVRLRKKGIPFSVFTSYWPTVWDGYTEAWLVGGDGTANYFVNHYPDFKLPIAVFPGGSGNDLHAALYGKPSLAKQIDLVLHAKAQPVDAGLCNGTLFLNGIGIGFDGAVVKSMLGTQKFAGKASYLIAILKNIVGYNEKRCTLMFDGKKVVQDCFMISIANGNSYGGGFRVAPKASLTDGVLDVMVVGNVNVLSRLRYLPVIEKGEHLHLPFISYQQADHVVVKSATPIAAHCDGEYFSADLFNIRCLEKRFSLLR